MPQTSKQYGHPDFYKLLDQMGELHSRKNHDYAGTSDPLKNLRACTRLELDPFIGVMVRLQDKWSRIEEFVKSKTLLVKDESVEDTLMDNAVYSLLAIILLREQKKNVAEIDKPRFKKGDRVRIMLRATASCWSKRQCKIANNEGIYVGTGDIKPYDHSIDTANISGFCIYDDELTLLEDN